MIRFYFDFDFDFVFSIFSSFASFSSSLLVSFPISKRFRCWKENDLFVAWLIWMCVCVCVSLNCFSTLFDLFYWVSGQLGCLLLFFFSIGRWVIQFQFESNWYRWSSIVNIQKHVPWSESSVIIIDLFDCHLHN